MHIENIYNCSYRPNHDEARVALLVAQIRNENNSGQTNIPAGEYANSKQREIQHYQAALAEIAVSRMFNLCWSGLGKGSLGCVDVGDLFEVRSISNINNGLLVRDSDKKGYPYLLIHVNRNSRVCTFIGWAFMNWATFEDIKSNGRVLGADTSKPAYILSQNKLGTIESLLTWIKENHKWIQT